MASPWMQALRQQQVITVIRAPSFEVGVKLAQAAVAGGMRQLEVTWNSAQPARTVAHLREHYPHCWVGAGTLLSTADCAEALAAGAQFCVSPHTDGAMMACAHRQGVPTMPGCLTPSEIMAAWQAGATAVKVFPISAVGGAAYLRSLQGPLPAIPLVPTGGVTLENAPQLLAAGATAVGLASSLFPATDVAQQRWQTISRRCEQLLSVLAQGPPPHP